MLILSMITSEILKLSISGYYKEKILDLIKESSVHTTLYEVKMTKIKI